MLTYAIASIGHGIAEIGRNAKHNIARDLRSLFVRKCVHGSRYCKASKCTGRTDVDGWCLCEYEPHGNATFICARHRPEVADWTRAYTSHN